MTTYYPHKISLSDGQKVRLARAFGPGEAVSLRFKNEALSRGSDTLHLTARQIKKNTARYQKQNGCGHRHEQDTNQTCAQDRSAGGRHAGKTSALSNTRKWHARQPCIFTAPSALHRFLG